MRHLQKRILLFIMMAVGFHFYAAAQVAVKGSHPDFLREGDKSFITATIANKTNQPITGQVHLSLMNPANNNPVDGWFQNVFPSQYYSLEAGANVRIQFPIQAAFGYIQSLQYQLEANVLENKKEVIANSKYTDSFYVYSNRVLMTDSIVLKTNKDTIIKGVFSALLLAPESSTHNNLSISFFASTPIEYWKLQMGNKQFTMAGRARFDTLLVGDFISNDMGNYSLQTSSSVAVNMQQTKIVWSQYNKVEKPIKSNRSFGIQKTIQQKINGHWVVLPQNPTLHVGDTLNVALAIGTPKPFKKIWITENTMGGATIILPKNLTVTKYASQFTKEIVDTPLKHQQIHYQYMLTSAGVFSTGNTFVNIETKVSKQSPIKLFIPATEIRVEE